MKRLKLYIIINESSLIDIQEMKLISCRFSDTAEMVYKLVEDASDGDAFYTYEPFVQFAFNNCALLSVCSGQQVDSFVSIPRANVEFFEVYRDEIINITGKYGTLGKNTVNSTMNGLMNVYFSYLRYLDNDKINEL